MSGYTYMAPVGAGDLIDRTVRLYRRHFWPLIRASAPPVVVSAAGGVVMTVANRGFTLTDSGERVLAYLGLLAAGFLLWLTGLLLHWVVMGGASRNLVMHLLWGEPVSARAIYRNVRARFFGLFFATLVVGVWILFSAGIAFFVWYLLLLVAGMAVALASFGSLPLWLGALAGITFFVVGACFALLVFFWLAGRVAYVPQVMTVEGRGVFDALGRSISLSRKNVRRLAAMILFTSFATFSALWLLLIPLGWIGHLYGVELITLDRSLWPTWFAVGYQVVGEVSTILLAPVWMLGLSLLYVDERVRHEGYDIEMQASRTFGPMPAVPQAGWTPLAPAVAPTQGARADAPLGLGVRQ